MIYNLTINIDGDFSDNWKEEDFKRLFEQGKGYFDIDVIRHEECFCYMLGDCLSALYKCLYDEKIL